MKSIPSTRSPDEPVEECIVPLPGPRHTIPIVTGFRSTWVISSRESIQDAGLEERYLENLRQHRDEVLSCSPNAWLPIRVARAHYRACDAIGLTSQDITAIVRGPQSGKRKRWHTKFVLGGAASPSGTLWESLARLDRMWLASANGGALTVFRVGAKQARIECLGCELFDLPYFRYSMRTVFLLMLEQFGGTSVVRVGPPPKSGECPFHLQWA
jgi:hypothetical protein